MKQSALGTLSDSLLSAKPIRHPFSPVIRICKVLCGIFKDERVSKNSGRSSLPSINVYQYDRNLDDRLDELFNCLTGEEGPVDGQQLAHTFIDVQLTKFYIPYLLNNMNIVRISWVFNHRGLSFALFPVDKSNVRVQTYESGISIQRDISQLEGQYCTSDNDRPNNKLTDRNTDGTECN